MAVSPVPLPSISCPYACVIDDAGRVLYAKNKDTQHKQMSTTKLMTAYVACLYGGNDTNFVSAPADLITGGSQSTSGESSAGIASGESMTTVQLLTAMMFPSGGDAARILGAYIGGTYLGAADTDLAGQTAFVTEMNNQAAALGMVNTQYQTPSGNVQDHSGTVIANHYSSAYDLCLNMRAMMNLGNTAMANGMRTAFLKGGDNVITTASPSPGHHYDNLAYGSLGNSYYPGAIGCKGGSWNGGGVVAWAFVLAATRGTHTIYAALMTDTTDTRAADLYQMLDYAFDQLNEHSVATATIQDGSSLISGWTRSGYFPANYTESYALISSAANDTLTFTVRGKVLRLFMPSGSSRGIASVFVDNVQDASVDNYSSTFVNAGVRGACWTKTFDTEGTHTVKIVNSGSKNPSSSGITLDFDYFTYDGQVERGQQYLMGAG